MRSTRTSREKPREAGYLHVRHLHMDALVKVLDLGAKYAWAVFVVCGVVLLIPDELASRMELLLLRRSYTAYLWIVMLFTGTLCFGALLPDRMAWRFVLCPLKKFAFPVTDRRSGIKQSRVRYRRVQFIYQNGESPIFWQAISSNGIVSGFYDDQGHRVLPEEQNDGYVEIAQTKQPKWGRLDWQDMFNGQANSGLWGIVEP